MDTKQIENENAVKARTPVESVPLIIEETDAADGGVRRSVRCGESMRRFISSPLMAVLAGLISVNGLLFMFSGYRWSFALPFSAELILTSAALWLTFADAKIKAAFEPRGLLLVSISVKVQEVIFFTFSGFFLIYVFFAFIKKDILFGATGNFFKDLSALGLWNVPLFLIISFIMYCTYRYLWHKSMFVDNFRDAAELGLIFGKGAAEFAGTCLTLAAVRIVLFVVKPASWSEAKFIPAEISSFLDAYGIGGNGGTLELLTVIFNVILLVYFAVLALVYIAKVKNFKKIKKRLDKRKKL